MAARDGTQEAISHDAKPISTPWPLPVPAPSGLAAMAVSHNAEASARLAMPENIRNWPRRRRLASPGLAPAASAIEKARGKRTPERAVLLGKAGAIRPSTRKML